MKRRRISRDTSEPSAPGDVAVTNSGFHALELLLPRISSRSRARAVVEARNAFVVAHDTRATCSTQEPAEAAQVKLSWTRTREVRAQELAGAGQGGVGFVEHRGEPLEHVRDARCDFEPDGDIGRGGAGGEPGGVVEEDLV